MRYERKFTAGIDQKEFAFSWLSHVCVKDSEYSKATIFSIYYDTFDLASYLEKANGDYLKTKVRLRWYDPSIKNENHQIPAFLETKRKIGSGGYKTRKKFFFDGAWLKRVPLDDPLLRQIVDENEDEESIGRHLFPVLTVIYERERFVCPYSGARVSLDTSIRSAAANKNLLPFIDSAYLDTIVIEIKEEGMTEIPWLEDLYHAGFRSESFSKYGMCISKLMHGG